ncbi:hypothetical protein ACWGJ2_17785 [Streptomyces sp. NPDC054796]
MTTEKEMVEVTSESELRELVGEPAPYAADKARTALHALDRARLSKALERRNDPLELLEQHYGPAYAETLYDG